MGLGPAVGRACTLAEGGQRRRQRLEPARRADRALGPAAMLDGQRLVEGSSSSSNGSARGAAGGAAAGDAEGVA